ALLLGASSSARQVPTDEVAPEEGPRPGAIGEPTAPVSSKHLYDTANLLNDAQEAKIEADTSRLQRFGLPVVILVQLNELSPNEASAFAAEVRRQWAVETEPGADDGLVMLVSINTVAGSISTTLSWGENALPNDGLNDALAATIDSEWLDAAIAESQLYEGILFSLRRMIYHSIYAPAPPAPLTTVQRITNATVDVVGPLLGLTGIAIAVAALRFRASQRAPAPVLVWSVGAAAVLVAVAAVWSRSGWGAAASIALLGSTAVLWVARDPAAHPSRPLGGSVMP
ncbi:MAG TPA: TPM domain-containing protein, partial [Thermomicrobiales bacterium]|nr:TPM domain-containing protein [Thermomicrobiales bacterium]